MIILNYPCPKLATICLCIEIESSVDETKLGLFYSIESLNCVSYISLVAYVLFSIVLIYVAVSDYKNKWFKPNTSLFIFSVTLAHYIMS